MHARIDIFCRRGIRRIDANESKRAAAIPMQISGNPYPAFTAEMQVQAVYPAKKDINERRSLGIKQAL
jgi:hypothetical protein